MIGLTAAVYCCFQLSLCLAGPIIWGYRHSSLSVRRKITANVFYSTFANVFCHVFRPTSFNVSLFLGNVFSYMTDSAKTEPYAVHCVIPKHYNECSKCPPLSLSRMHAPQHKSPLINRLINDRLMDDAGPTVNETSLQLIDISHRLDPLADLFFLIGWLTHHNGWLADLNG